jgi:V-type H+-transporting ATPase subunit E
VLDDLFETTDSQIHEISSNEEQYATLLHGLVLQGAYSLMDKDMAIRCRQQDVDAVNSVIQGVADQFEEKLNYRPTFTVSDDHIPKSR